MSNDQAQRLSILNLLVRSGHYQIPVYQRNYAWGRKQIRQLIQDIYDYFDKSKSGITENYYLGSLVVAKKDKYFEVLDGQQRFTTLNLLACYLKSSLDQHTDLDQFDRIHLGFESRDDSEIALKGLWNHISHQSKHTTIDHLISEYGHHPIFAGYKAIAVEMNEIVKRDDFPLFAAYLFNQVIILKVAVPELTDVTHYFDALNNRGEQLEQHEVIKAHFLSLVKDNPSDQQVFSQVWNACQDMYRYVQYGFSAEIRKCIFGESYHDWLITDYDKLKQILVSPPDIAKDKQDAKSDTENNKQYGDRLSLDEVLALSIISIKDEQPEESLERFTSIIDYPNFLMHVVKVFTLTYAVSVSLPAIALDDKGLLKSFKQTITNAGQAKDFIYFLLKFRYLFDLYIIKRENNNQYKGWSLKRPNYYSTRKSVSFIYTFSGSTELGKSQEDFEGDQSHLVMLLSALHVSYPTYARKNWLSAVMYWLVRQESIDLQSYIGYLEKFARVLLKSRYLTADPLGYDEFMYCIDDKQEVPLNPNIGQYLKYRKATQFVFNYLDYLIWKTKIKTGIDKVFYFTIKDSVEHFYPQQPKTELQKLDDSQLNCFGNLCLLNQSENSILSNDLPIQKIQWLKNKTKAPISLKLQCMMLETSEHEGEWGAERIEQHHQDMLQLLITHLDKI